MRGARNASRTSGRPRGPSVARGLLFAPFFLACGRPDAERIEAEPAPSVPAMDRLAPGELVAGDKKAFSLALPRDVKIDQALTDIVFASGPVSASDLANYVRARVREGTVNIGATATVFDRVKLVDDPARSLFVRIFPGPSGRGSRMEIRDVTTPLAPAMSSTAEQWRKFGLSPDGKLLDPEHLR